MSLEACLPDMLARGDINQDQHDRIMELYDAARQAYSRSMGADAAAARASGAALEQFAAEATLKRRQAVLQTAAQSRILRNASRFKDAADRGEAFIGTITHSDRAPYQNADALMQVIRTQAHGMMQGILEKFSRNIRGQVRKVALLRNVVREAFGEETGDIGAKELAKAWGDTAEMLRVRFNEAGGSIGKMEKWGLPQRHDYQSVRAVDYETWRNFVQPLLDPERMMDPRTGMKMTPQGLELALRDVYEQIRSDGWAFRQPGSNAGLPGKLANRHGDPRFLIFKDADSWMAYADRFGRPQSTVAAAIDPEGPIFDAMMGHISGMSRDIAMMETLGPNPAATVRWMNDVLEREAKTGPGTRFTDAKVIKAQHTLNDVYAELAGTGHAPIATKWGSIFGAVRSLQTAAKLGSATVSALTDVGFQATTRAFNGMPIRKALTGYARQFNPLSAVDREIAARIGFGADQASHSAVAQSRYLGEVLTGEIPARLAESTLRLSGLSAWTEAGKRAFAVDFLNHITSERGKAWGTLHTGFRKAMERYGFDQASWDTLRATPLEDHGGAKWIMPGNIADRELRERLMGMILTETKYAVPEADLRTRALLNQKLPPKGTFWGEVIRTPLQFKTFGVSMLLTHGRRMMEQQGWHRAAYAAGLALTTGVIGALVIGVLKPLLAGKDPMAMASDSFGVSPVFVAQALAQGGGFGIAGDFLQSATDRYEDALYQYLLGPVIGDAINIGRVGGQGVKALRGQTNTFNRSLIRTIQGDLPGSSLWFSKLAFQRAVTDQAQRWADPNYFDAQYHMQERARQQGQGYWWTPGEFTPNRAPDMTTALKAPPPKPGE
jgi:hypothetical protein